MHETSATPNANGRFDASTSPSATTTAICCDASCANTADKVVLPVPPLPEATTTVFIDTPSVMRSRASRREAPQARSPLPGHFGDELSPGVGLGHATVERHAREYRHVPGLAQTLDVGAARSIAVDDDSHGQAELVPEREAQLQVVQPERGRLRHKEEGVGSAYRRYRGTRDAARSVEHDQVRV
ncbi:MAG TPA: hypothetical protein VIJ45_07025, partial [Coriobacteriia bacterium]